MSEDETTFHGEFSDDWTVSGKVPNIFILQNALGLQSWYKLKLWTSKQRSEYLDIVNIEH